MRRYSSIVAKSNNNVIGVNGRLPFTAKADMANFKSLTTDNYVIMGTKTLTSIGRPLPNRMNLVLTTRTADSHLPMPEKDNLKYFRSKEEVDRYVEGLSPFKLFVIGGEQIYRKCLEENRCSRIYCSTVDVECDGDVFFPEIELDKWVVTYYENITDPKSYLLSDENKNPLSYTYEVLERKKSL